MPESLQSHVASLPITDVHEHHMPEFVLNPDVGLLDLLCQSYAGWTRARPYPLPSEPPIPDSSGEESQETTWDSLQPFLRESGSNAFVRNLVVSLAELYELGEAAITEANWKHLDGAVRRAHADPDWRLEVIRRAKIETLITDPFTQPLLDARETFGDNYRSVLRINAFAFGWHPLARDHNGNSAHDLIRHSGLQVKTFDDYLTALEHFVDTLGEHHRVALKNALAYDRSVDFDDVDEDLARRAWGKEAPSPEERKAFGDVVVDRLCRLAGERNVPVQVHLGTAVVRGSHPLGIAGLVERHPRTRFLLMHLAYPWSRDLLGMAFVYRNIWLDLTWSFLLSPSHFKLALHESIEVLPDESRMMLGGDNLHVEETYGAMITARRLIAEVLEEKVEAGYFGVEDARRLARKIFHENGREFFGFDVPLH